MFNETSGKVEEHERLLETLEGEEDRAKVAPAAVLEVRKRADKPIEAPSDHQRQPAPLQEVQLPRRLGRHRQGPDEPARGELRARLRRGSRLVGGAGAQGGRRRRSGVGGGRQRARAEGSKLADDWR